MSERDGAPRERPSTDAKAIVFKVRDVTPAHGWAFDWVPHDLASPALRAVIDYVEAHGEEGAELSPLHTLAEGAGPRGRNWDLALRGVPPSELGGGTYHLRLAAEEDSAMLLRELRADRERVVYAEPPAMYYPVRPLLEPPELGPLTPLLATGGANHGWQVDRCRFPEVWDDLDDDTGGGEICVIDNGSGGLGHRELFGRLVEIRTSQRGQPSTENHAGAVAAVIAARRGEPLPTAPLDMNGCCSAGLRVFNAWTEALPESDGIDFKLFNDALLEIAALEAPVLNLSLSSSLLDSVIHERLDGCLDAGVAVVAAVGNDGPNVPPRFPASHPGVIAVTATTMAETRWPKACVGAHVFIGAPGEKIFSVAGDTGYSRFGGTSFSAGIVSAAIWLARRNRAMTVGEVRGLLSMSVAGGTGPAGGGRNTTVGFGRLDMVELRSHLHDSLPSIP
jgi:subtilase family protein